MQCKYYFRVLAQTSIYKYLPQPDNLMKYLCLERGNVSEEKFELFYEGNLDSMSNLNFCVPTFIVYMQ